MWFPQNYIVSGYSSNEMCLSELRLHVYQGIQMRVVILIDLFTCLHWCLLKIVPVSQGLNLIKKNLDVWLKMFLFHVLEQNLKQKERW